jgi:hypothetical protein
MQGDTSNPILSFFVVAYYSFVENDCMLGCSFYIKIGQQWQGTASFSQWGGGCTGMEYMSVLSVMHRLMLWLDCIQLGNDIRVQYILYYFVF